MSNAHQWRVVVTPRAEKELKALPSRDQARIRKDIDVLAISPKRVDARKLRGKGDEWPLRGRLLESTLPLGVRFSGCGNTASAAPSPGISPVSQKPQVYFTPSQIHTCVSCV